MNINGLAITSKEFDRLPRKQKDMVIFHNLEYIRTRVKTWNLKVNIQYGWLVALTLAIGWIIQTLIK